MMYVPLLKWKQGEQNALKNLSDGVKCKISPILELVKIPKRKYPPSTKEYIEENINSILSSWGGAYFGRIRTLIPATSGQRFGIIRTA